VAGKIRGVGHRESKNGKELSQGGTSDATATETGKKTHGFQLLPGVGSEQRTYKLLENIGGGGEPAHPRPMTSSSSLREVVGIAIAGG
jgi:hypothetical protein